MIHIFFKKINNFFYWLFATEKIKLIRTTASGSKIYRGNAMALKLKIWIYIPDGWKHGNPANRTVYMFDGQNMFDIGTSAYGTWALERKLDEENDSRTVIVGIQHGIEREYDYSLAQNADGTISRVIGEIIPYIEGSLIGTQTTAQRLLGGSSLGANAAIAGIKRSDVFSKFLLFSFAAEVDYRQHLAYVQALPADSSVRVYLDIGTKEASCQEIDWVTDDGMVSRCYELTKIFRNNYGRNNVLFFLDRIQCYHCEAAWGNRFVEALGWIDNG